MIWLWFWWILSKFAVCLLQKVCNFGKSFEKCYPEHFVFILFFSLFNCLLFWYVPFSIGQRRPYIIPCASVDEFKTARSAEGKILLNIIGFLNILWEFYGIFRSDTGEFRNQFWIYSGKTLRPFLLFVCVCVCVCVFLLFLFCFVLFFFCSLLG